MFNHKALALDGVGFGHKVMSILGTRWFNVDVIVTPASSGGGGYVVGPPIYNVKFVITFKSGKVVTSEHKYSKLGIETLEKVIATFKSASKIIEYVSFRVGSINKLIKQIIVKVKR
jgi:hypothetical protein